ncbi:hypothetical protein SK128_003938 [Halocaridina rubra]|uniref:Uncharacterized protein n=1 Tax=Halocaridina rubra TaxID=373956 RepID=A0AAN8WMB5_HALRR
MMRVLAVTLGRSLRPQQNGEDPRQPQSSSNHFLRKPEASKSLLTPPQRQPHSKKPQEKESNGVRKSVSKNAVLKSPSQTVSGQVNIKTNNNNKKPLSRIPTVSKNDRDSTRSTKSLIPSKSGNGGESVYAKATVRGKETQNGLRNNSKANGCESPAVVAPNYGNEPKSARVTRIPKETMSAHRSKLVRNSSLSKLRAKFRRQPLTSGTGNETDTEQLLSESEDRENSTHRITDLRDILVSHSNSQGSPMGDQSEISTSSMCSTSSKNSSYGSVKRQYGLHLDLRRDVVNPSVIHEEVNHWVSRVKKDERSWSNVPPPRCLTPHKVHIGSELIPWVDPVELKDGGESTYYLPMGGRLSMPLNTRAQSVCGGYSSLPYQRPQPHPTSLLSPSVTPETKLGSWPRPSKWSEVETGTKVYAGRLQALPGAPPCVAQTNNFNTTISDGLPSETNGSDSPFGTFPRRRPLQKVTGFMWSE